MQMKDVATEKQNAVNAKRIELYKNALIKDINGKITKYGQNASKFGNFSQNDMQQIINSLTQTLSNFVNQNKNQPQPQPQQPKGPNADEQAGAEMTNKAINAAAGTPEAEEEVM